jgi:DNA-binding transcriptional MerR regulator
VAKERREERRKERQSIGEVAKQTGVPVKTLRFYADEGIVPPSGRSRSGYRLYSDADVARLELVRTLRAAGLSLKAIRAVLARDMTLAQALRLRLGAVEAHIASLRQIAAALRATLHREPDDQDLRRLTMVTRLSHEERKALIARFYQKVAEGIPADKPEMREKLESSLPRLPDDPTPDQLDAWVELTELIADPTFAESLNANAKEVWQRGLDVDRLQAVNARAVAAAASARATGAPPDSAAATTVVDDYLAGLAGLASRDARDPAFRAGVRQRFARQDPRTSRYWQLVTILNSAHPMAAHIEDWRWIVQALLRQVPEPA